MEEVVYNSQYRELLSVVNAQKHQLSSLQADVTKVCDVTGISGCSLRVCVWVVGTCYL